MWALFIWGQGRINFKTVLKLDFKWTVNGILKNTPVVVGQCPSHSGTLEYFSIMLILLRLSFY